MMKGRSYVALLGSLVLHAALAAGLFSSLRVPERPLLFQMNSIEVIDHSVLTSTPSVPITTPADPSAANSPKEQNTLAAYESLKGPAQTETPSTSLRLYLSLIRDRLSTSLRFPEESLRVPLRVTLRLTLLSTGQIQAPKITQSSGSTRFDQAILKSLNSVGNLPPYSPEVSRQPQLTLSLPIELRPGH